MNFNITTSFERLEYRSINGPWKKIAKAERILTHPPDQWPAHGARQPTGMGQKGEPGQMRCGWVGSSFFHSTKGIVLPDGTPNQPISLNQSRKFRRTFVGRLGSEKNNLVLKRLCNQENVTIYPL
jgi:hypothetical protein